MIRCVFRVAAGPRLGFGHLMRARALARALGVRPVASIRGGAAARRTARALGFALLDDRPRALDRADAFIVDDPSAAHRLAWLGRVSRLRAVSVAVLDSGTRQRHADLVVNGSVSPTRGVSSPALLAGSRFYILDTRIAGVRRTASAARSARPARRVLLALGGGAHVITSASRVVAAVRARVPDAQIGVAAGFVGRRRAPLDGGRWLFRPRGLAGALASADVAILAGGVTMYEACALGVPTVGVAVVRAQRPAIRCFAASGAVVDAGGPALDAATLDRVASGVERLLTDPVARRRSGTRARGLVDALGATRVARHIHRLVVRRAHRG